MTGQLATNVFRQQGRNVVKKLKNFEEQNFSASEILLRLLPEEKN
jgi:hypothetical protein